MSREVTHDAQEPDVISTEDRDGDIYVCRCGLSDDRPFCDGAHRATEDEADGVTYKYENDDADGPRRAIESIQYADD